MFAQSVSRVMNRSFRPPTLVRNLSAQQPLMRSQAPTILRPSFVQQRLAQRQFTGSNTRAMSSFNITLEKRDGTTQSFSIDTTKKTDLGLEGSLLGQLQIHTTDLTEKTGIVAECGGECSCCTCAADVVKGADSLNPKSEEEADMLDLHDTATDTSRLLCQAVANGKEEVHIRLLPEED